MTDEKRKGAQDAAAGPVAGEKLAEARRLRQISLPDIARELHLDEPKVQALEENRFDVLGAPVFAKGHLRKYAEIVGVSIDDIMADYYTLNRAAGAPPVVGKPREKIRELNLGPWLVILPLLLVLGAVAWWWLGRVPAVDAPAMPPAQAEEAAAEPAAVRQAVTRDPRPAATADEIALPPATPPADDAPALAAPGAVTDNAAPAAGEQPQISAADTLQLTLAFSGDCWTEVTDGNGDRLFFDLGSAGRTVNLSGPPPFRVLLGNAGNVNVQVNGEAYTIRAADRRGDTARLTLTN